jgi:Lar family restriction alleviation protein
MARLSYKNKKKGEQAMMLKPCPFCGSDELMLSSDLGETQWMIRCSHCNVRTSCFSDKNDAAEIWNRRIAE